MIDLASYRTDSRTSKFWVTPSNEIIQLTTFHYQYFSDPVLAQRYGVPFDTEIPTRLAALRVGFVRGNYERNGGRLTIESMRFNRALRKLIDELVLFNCEALDQVRMTIIGLRR
jgi:hypothetical protein